MTSAPTRALPQPLVAALTELAAGPQLLVALDFDGVLAPIVLRPRDARALPESRDALHALARLPGVRVALVSGRPLAELAELAEPPPEAVLIGSHGAQSTLPLGVPAGDHDLDLLGRLAAELDRIVAGHPGTGVERKPTGVVLHTRRAERPVAASAARAALAGPATWPGVHLTEGKEVVELAVTDVTKGSALAALRSRLGLPRGGVLYAGDDVTDERAFAVLDDDAGDVTVKVGEGDTVARHRIEGPVAVTQLLTTLLGLLGG